MLLFSRTLVLVGSKDGFASTLANKLASWFWRWQKGFNANYKSYGSQTSLSPLRLSLALPLPPPKASPPKASPPKASPPMASPPKASPPKASPPSSLVLESRSPLPRVKSKPSPTGLYPQPSPRSWSDSGILKIPRRMLPPPPSQVQKLGSRSIHTSRQLGKSSKCGDERAKDCESMKDICKKKKNTCADTTSCKSKDEECYPERPKCVPREDKKPDDDDQICPKSCIRGGKCIIAPVKKPPKMIYGSTECPPPKLVSPRTCPKTAAHDYVEEEPICSEKALLRKLKREACQPPALPGPPTDPVPLCPCPPPPKLHPGPCPCPVQMEELKIKPTPPCPIKDKYPCCMPIYYCPPKKPCVRKLPCDQVRKSKAFNKKK